MTVWAIADLHLAFSAPDKDMAFFGPVWTDYAQRIQQHWHSLVAEDDLVLIAGDISWALRLEDAVKDLEWIDALPGTKVLIKGNHDYWWSSRAKVQKLAPPSLHFLQHNSFNWRNVSISGTRLWDSEEYNFAQYIELVENPREVLDKTDVEQQRAADRKIFERELHRLELAAKSLDPKAKVKIIMTHYPPISADLQASRAAQILERYEVDICLFGHLHNIKPGLSLFGTRHGVRYILSAADYLRFEPLAVIDDATV